MSITVSAGGSSQEGHGKPVAPLVRPESLLEAWQATARAARIARETGVPRGPITGFTEIDHTMGGALEPGVHVVHGGAGCGKSAFAQGPCRCAAASVHLPVGTGKAGPLHTRDGLMRTLRRSLPRRADGALGIPSG